jgi:hypothetical protein
MLHLPAKALALIATDMADMSAGQEDGSRYPWIKCRLAGDDISSGVAYVGTVEVKTDAAQKRFPLWFSKTGISAGSTRLRAIKAGLDALRQDDAVYLWLGGAALHHGTSKAHCGSPLLFFKHRRDVRAPEKNAAQPIPSPTCASVSLQAPGA